MPPITSLRKVILEESNPNSYSNISYKYFHLWAAKLQINERNTKGKSIFSYVKMLCKVKFYHKKHYLFGGEMQKY